MLGKWSILAEFLNLWTLELERVMWDVRLSGNFKLAWKFEGVHARQVSSRGISETPWYAKKKKKGWLSGNLKLCLDIWRERSTWRHVTYFTSFITADVHLTKYCWWLNSVIFIRIFIRVTTCAAEPFIFTIPYYSLESYNGIFSQTDTPLGG